MSTAAEYTLVLLGRFPGKDRAVATALAREFGRDDAWGIQVVGAAPIVMVEGLTSEQAQAVHAAIADVEAAGSRFEIQPSVDPSLPKLSWPAPPRIKGKLISEFGSVAGNSVTLVLPCPYTGQKMKLTLNVSVTRGEQIGITASAAPMPVSHAAAPVNSIPAPAPRPIPVPVPFPMPAANNAAANAAAANAYRPIPTPVVLPTAKPSAAAAPAASSDYEELDSLDELIPMEAAPVARPQTPISRSIPAPSRNSPGSSMARSIPAPSMRGSGAAPLPDIPVIHNQAPANFPATSYNDLQSSNAAPMPVDLLSAPMDLSAFEAGVSASGIMRAVTVNASASGTPVSPAQIAEPGGSGMESFNDEGALCSVSIGKSGSPKVHQLVADLQGISVAEAARLCQKPIVTLAKDISGAEARGIKQQFATVNVVAKITRRG